MISILEKEDQFIVMETVIIGRRLCNPKTDIPIGLRNMTNGGFVREEDPESEMSNPLGKILFFE